MISKIIVTTQVLRKTPPTLTLPLEGGGKGGGEQLQIILKERPGQALVEVVIATLIAAMTTMSVFSVVLSATVQQGKADKREAAALVLKQAQEVLKSYVSVEPQSANIVPGVSPVKPGAPNGGKWTYDTSGAAWALSSGNHDISGLLTGTPLDVPGQPAPTLNYLVTDYDCGFGTGYKACKLVVFTLTYPD